MGKLIEASIRITKPPERGILVLSDDTSPEVMDGVAEALVYAREHNDWPVVIGGLKGPVYYVGDRDELLRQRVRRLLRMLDGDEAGDQAAEVEAIRELVA